MVARFKAFYHFVKGRCVWYVLRTYAFYEWHARESRKARHMAKVSFLN